MKLSKTEEVLMTHLWSLGRAFMKDLIYLYPEPKPATTTIATLLKRMTDKGFVDYEVIGNSRQYFPLVAKSSYVSGRMQGMVKNFFGDSAPQFASFFTKSSEFTMEELRELRGIIDEEIKKKSK